MNNATLSATGTVVTGGVLLTRILHQGKAMQIILSHAAIV
jgi:hypothetical protein